MNFGFSIERPPVELLDLFSVSAAAMDCLSEEAKVSTRRWANVFADEDFQLALDAEESGDAVRLKMNFHYSTPSAAMAAAVLSRPGLFERHWGTSLAMAKSLSNQDLEESNAYD